MGKTTTKKTPAPKSKWTTSELSDKVTDLTGRLDGIESTVTEVKSTATQILDRLGALLPPVNTTTPATSVILTATTSTGGGKITTRSSARVTAPYTRPTQVITTAAQTHVVVGPITVPTPIQPAVNLPLTGALSQLLPAPQLPPAALQVPAMHAATSYQPITTQVYQQLQPSAYVANSQYAQPTAQAVLQSMSHLHVPADLRPLAMPVNPDPAVTMRVQALLDTAQHISGVKGKRTHAHEFVTRGPTRTKTTLAAIEIPEYLYGLKRLATDDKTPLSDRPKILEHFDQVLIDAKDFDWEQVREWSEEVLSGVADGTMKWSDPYNPNWSDPAIATTRSELSHFRPGRLFPTLASVMLAAEKAAARAAIRAGTTPTIPAAAAAGYATAHSTSAAQASYTSQPRPANAPGKPKRRAPTTVGRSDVVCEAFNSPTGCNKEDGHLIGSVAQGHHCSWCRSTIQLLHTHSYSSCNIKANYRGPAFFRQ